MSYQCNACYKVFDHEPYSQKPVYQYKKEILITMPWETIPKVPTLELLPFVVCIQNCPGVHEDRKYVYTT